MNCKNCKIRSDYRTESGNTIITNGYGTKLSNVPKGSYTLSNNKTSDIVLYLHGKPDWDGYLLQSIEFCNRNDWFDFVRRVNAANRKIKKLPKNICCHAPIFQEEKIILFDCYIYRIYAM